MSDMPVTAFAVFLVSTAVILAVFGFVARSTNVHREVNYASANRLRLLFFVSLAIILLTFLAITLPRLPYPGRSPRVLRRRSRTGTARSPRWLRCPLGRSSNSA
jgi:hypothetical protein